MKKILAFAAIAAFVVACDSSSGGGSSGTKDQWGNCVGTEGQTCTGIDEYNNCVTSKCGTEVNDVLAKCATLISCTQACKCDSAYQTCQQACATKIDAACQTSFTAAGTCVQANCMDKLPKCTTGGGGGSNCDAAKSCCTQLLSQPGGEAYKAYCDNIGAMGDENCKTWLDGVKQGGLCN
jgi:hypothetical protein